MQGVVREPAAESGIEARARRQAPRGPLAWPARLRLDLSDDAPQTRHPLRSAAWRHSVRVLLFVICSCFGPSWRGSQGRRRGWKTLGHNLSSLLGCFILTNSTLTLVERYSVRCRFTKNRPGSRGPRERVSYQRGHPMGEGAVDSNLLTLAEARFGGQLSDAERKLLHAALTGEEAPADLNAPENDPANAQSWGQDRAIRAALIQWLCFEPKAREQVHPFGIRAIGARIEGRTRSLLRHDPLSSPHQSLLVACRDRAAEHLAAGTEPDEMLGRPAIPRRARRRALAARHHGSRSANKRFPLS